MYACMHVCMYACMHVCMYVCMYVFCVCNLINVDRPRGTRPALDESSADTILHEYAVAYRRISRRTGGRACGHLVTVGELGPQAARVSECAH